MINNEIKDMHFNDLLTLCNAKGDVDNDRLEIFRIKQNLKTNKQIIQDYIQNDALEYLEMLESYEN